MCLQCHVPGFLFVLGESHDDSMHIISEWLQKLGNFINECDFFLQHELIHLPFLLNLFVRLLLSLSFRGCACSGHHFGCFLATRGSYLLAYRSLLACFASGGHLNSGTWWAPIFGLCCHMALSLSDWSTKQWWRGAQHSNAKTSNRGRILLRMQCAGWREVACRRTLNKLC